MTRNRADEIVDPRLVKRHGSGTVSELRTKGLGHGALVEVLEAPHLHHIVHLLHIRKLCKSPPPFIIHQPSKFQQTETPKEKLMLHIAKA